MLVADAMRATSPYAFRQLDNFGPPPQTLEQKYGKVVADKMRADEESSREAIRDRIRSVLSRRGGEHWVKGQMARMAFTSPAAAAQFSADADLVREELRRGKES